ncbi:hypothetical protein C8A00DRAFT_46849 [Chaetomidium leptoderma]|uniref:Uncharacterized protein n=1 Tax=Chaetomidium leptoderma TaxID=669021 RepID=A0AAN6VED7_9PEZI|nr:hypothetical protein C8A00DRAFT_46849 [Chaetomidium leptoderma]
MAPVTGNFSEVVNHGDPDLKCSPATPWSIFIFFLSNYLSHCATVISYPGFSPVDTVAATALALFLPSSGITRAMFAIARHSRFRRKKNALERAAAAGALRIVGDRIKPQLNGLEKIQRRLELDQSPAGNTDLGEAEDGRAELTPPEQRAEHIRPLSDTSKTAQEKVISNMPMAARVSIENFPAWLPRGYSWANVDDEAVIEWTGPPTRPQDVTGGLPGLCSNYNWIQSLVAIFQVGGAAFTLYESRGNQTDHYGYTAFGLTVVPYLIMSILNLFAQVLTASYPNVYMVGSPEMDEARRRGGVFDGVVGRLVPLVEDGDADKPTYEVRLVVDNKGHKRIKVMERVSGSDSYPRAIRLARANDRSGPLDGDLQVTNCTPYKRYSVRSDVFRFFVGVHLYFFLPILLASLSIVMVGAMTRFEGRESTRAQRGWTLSWLVVPLTVALLGVFCVPAIGGFVVVANMLTEYGICEAA